MIECPLCKNKVERLKSNSHIFPRWMMLITKHNGVNLKYDSFDDDIRNNQTDLKADIVCYHCEELFGKDDRFSYEFLKSKKYLLREEKDYELHDQKISLKLRLFVFSILLRFHLYMHVNHSKNQLGPHFEDIRKCYLTKDTDYCNYLMLLSHTEDSTKHIITPHRAKRINNKNIVSFDAVGYRFMTFVDSSFRPSIIMKKISVSDIRIPVAKIKFLGSDISKHLASKL